MSSIAEIISRLEDMAEQTEHILSVVQPITFEEFLGNYVSSAAVIRFFEVTGEAAKNIPDDVRNLYPEIPWKELSGFRDVLIHQYPKVNLRMVWNFAINDVPSLHENILKALFDLRK